MDVRRVLEKLVYEGPGFTDIIIYVKPEASETRLVLEGDELVFYTNEPNIEGRPNASLTYYLARLFNIPTSRVEIVYGVRASVKRVRIYEVDKETVVDVLAEHVSKQ